MAGDPTVTAFPDGDNLFHWVATVVGGKGTVYDGLRYKLSLTFPSRYPYTAPTVKFVTPCYHPNVDNQGNICLDILKVLGERVHWSIDVCNFILIWFLNCLMMLCK